MPDFSRAQASESSPPTEFKGMFSIASAPGAIKFCLTRSWFQVKLSVSIRSLTSEMIGAIGVNSGVLVGVVGIHLSVHALIKVPSPTRVTIPASKASQPAMIARQVADAALGAEAC